MKIWLIFKEWIKRTLSSLGIFLSKNQRYDHETFMVMKRLLNKNSNCVDVGCHKGEVLLDMIKLAPNGKHIGFEPIPEFYENLKIHFSDSCDIYPYALNDKSGTQDFKHVVSDPAYSGLKERDYKTNSEEVKTIRVESKTMDEVLLDKGQSIDLIKIDVEGAEMQVLNGAKGILKRYRPVIIFEHGKGASNYYGTKPADIYNLLAEENGLKVTLLTRFLKNQGPLNLQEFEKQYEDKLNYYFLAY